mgnify:CR=1 FL=1
MTHSNQKYAFGFLVAVDQHSKKGNAGEIHSTSLEFQPSEKQEPRSSDMAVIYEREDCKEVYSIHALKVLPFYTAYFAWQIFEATMIPFLCRKIGFFKKYWLLKDWMINLPWLWGYKEVFPKNANITLIEPWDDPYWRAYMSGYMDGSM